MKLQLTKQAELELERINKLYGDEESLEFDNWNKMNKSEILITDAGLYTDECYESNAFENLEEWCKLVQELEYNEEYSKKHPNIVFKKINKMIKANILEIIESSQS